MLIQQEVDKIKKKSISITYEDINKLKYFLEIMNIPHLKRNMEADLVCSKLSQLGLVDFVISEDMDHLTSGTSILLRDFNNKNNMVTSFNSDIAIAELGLSREKWIELCILFGCDYVSRIRGVGYKSSYKYIMQNKNEEISTIIKQIEIAKKNAVPDNYLEKVLNAKTIFLNNVDIQVDENSIFNTTLYDNQVEVARNYLTKYSNISPVKINNRLKNIFRYCI